MPTPEERDGRPFEPDRGGAEAERGKLEESIRKMRQETQPEPILQYFDFEYLPEPLQGVSAPFDILARTIVRDLPRNPERTVALRKLLESKDAAVRAALAR